LGQSKNGLIRQVNSEKKFKSYEISMTGQEKSDILIKVTA